MSVIEDLRKVIQDLVAPELKSLSAEGKAGREESRLRDESLARDAKMREELLLAKLEAQKAKIEALSAKMDYQYASIMNALNLDKRVELLERDRQVASA